MPDNDSVGSATEVFQTKPETDTKCKKVPLRGERGDTVAIEGYGEMEVVRRLGTYYGTVLQVRDDVEEQQYELFARDPREQLRLFERVQDEEGYVVGLRDLGEVKAELRTGGQYDICDCGEPIKTMEHDRLAVFRVGEHG